MASQDPCDGVRSLGPTTFPGVLEAIRLGQDGAKPQHKRCLLTEGAHSVTRSVVKSPMNQHAIKRAIFVLMKNMQKGFGPRQQQAHTVGVGCLVPLHVCLVCAKVLRVVLHPPWKAPSRGLCTRRATPQLPCTKASLKNRIMVPFQGNKSSGEAKGGQATR